MCTRFASSFRSCRVVAGDRARRGVSSQHSERGSVTGFVVCSVMMLVACAGLAFDGGRMISAYVQASDVAENASRAGSQVVVGIRAGNPRLNTVRARQQAMQFLASTGFTGVVRTDAQHVEVEVTRVVQMRILGLFGVGDKVIRVTRTSSPFVG